MPSGWTRLILENFEFPYERVFPPDLDKGNLREKYDVLVFNGAGLQAAAAGAAADAAAAATPPAGGRRGAAAAGAAGAAARRCAADAVRGRARRRTRRLHAAADPRGVRAPSGAGLGADAGADQAVRAGGRHAHRDRQRREGAVQQFELPLTNHLVENGSAAAAREVLRAGRGAARRGRRHEPAGARARQELDVFFDNNPVFKLGAEAAGKGLRRVAWFARRRAAAQRLGLGPAVSRQGRRRSSRPTSARDGCS